MQEAIGLGNIDMVFNNAGYGLTAAVESNTEGQIRAQFETNFFGTVWVIQQFIPYFRNKKQGLFINITSLCGLTSNPQSVVYNASKWALSPLGFRQSFN